jgi:hypothetical protein
MGAAHEAPYKCREDKRRTGRKGEAGRQTQGGIRQGKDPIRGPIVVNLPAYLG